MKTRAQLAADCEGLSLANRDLVRTLDRLRDANAALLSRNAAVEASLETARCLVQNSCRHRVEFNERYGRYVRAVRAAVRRHARRVVAAAILEDVSQAMTGFRVDVDRLIARYRDTYDFHATPDATAHDALADRPPWAIEPELLDIHLGAADYGYYQAAYVPGADQIPVPTLRVWTRVYARPGGMLVLDPAWVDRVGVETLTDRTD